MITTTASSRTPSPPPEDERRPLLTIEFDGLTAETPDDETHDMLVVISGPRIRFIPLQDGELDAVTDYVKTLRGDA